MQKNEFSYKSKDRITDIYALEWKPDSEIKGVVQVAHGGMWLVSRI